MKLRMGFVSNSSSSSFLVGFKKVPTTIKEMKQLLFGDEEFLGTYGGEPVPTSQIAQTVLDDLMRASEWQCEEDMPGYLQSDYITGFEFQTKMPLYPYAWNVQRWQEDENGMTLFDEAGRPIPAAPDGRMTYDEFDALPTERQAEIWEKYNQECEVAAAARTKELREAWKDCKIFHFRYADDDGGYFAILEHGEIFSNLPHVRISEH